MNGMSRLEVIRAAALQATVDALRDAFEVSRCTLRLAGAERDFDVAYEARLPGVRTLIGDTDVSLRGQPVVEALMAGAQQVVQHDSASASDDPAFQRMLISYGGMGSQIVTPVRSGGRLEGIISLHQLGEPRRWTDAECALAMEAARLVSALLTAGRA